MNVEGLVEGVDAKVAERCQMSKTGVWTLAANCSPRLLELLSVNPDVVDAVKVSEFDNEAYVRMYRELSRAKPLILHGVVQRSDRGRPPSPGTPGFAESLCLDSLRAALQICHPPYVSVHLEHYSVPHLEPDDFLGRLVADLALLTKATGLPVHLENTHFYFPKPGTVVNAPYTCDPGFIREALSATGSRLLLDIPHAQVAAWHRGENVLDYIRSLPLEIVDEVHVVSPMMVDGELRDRHREMTEDSYELLQVVLQECPARTVSLEYDGLGDLFEGRTSKEALRSQLERLRAMLVSM